MRTRATLKPESLQLARQACLGVILRGLRPSVVSIRAKQSQFQPADRRRVGATHASPASPQGPGAARWGQTYQTKPIRWASGAKQTQFPFSRAAGHARLSGTKPIRGPIVQNKANFQRRLKCEMPCVKQEKASAWSSSLPILNFTREISRRWSRQADCAKRTQFHGGPVGPKDGLYKQTQFADRDSRRVCETKPIGPERLEW